ncbi:MAG: enoyl-CoA hydratase/isomerase family protein [Chloroflexi bacterium]|nr:enoyl-CoA hydratase/isomerase family protein [Chloroflexota bacterium]
MPEVTYSREGRIARIRMSAPSRGNAFTPQMRREMNQALVQYQQDAEAWMAVVSAEGKDFCVGSADTTPKTFKERRERGRLWAGGYVEAWKPIIGAIQGQCKGEGLALALSCDLRCADDTTRISVGGDLSDPDVVAAWLAPLVGLSSAFELLWLGRTLSSREAQGIGLVNRVILKGQPPEEAAEEGRLPMLPMPSTITVPNGDVMTGAERFAQEMLQYAPITRNFQKMIGLRSIGMPFHYAQTLEIGLNPYASEDRVEGNRAFAENRRPVWRNR